MNLNHTFLLHYPLPTHFCISSHCIFKIVFIFLCFPSAEAIPLAQSLHSSFYVRSMPLCYSRALHSLVLLLWHWENCLFFFTQIVKFPIGINRLIAVSVGSHLELCPRHQQAGVSASQGALMVVLRWRSSHLLLWQSKPKKGLCWAAASCQTFSSFLFNGEQKMYRTHHLGLFHKEYRWCCCSAITELGSC